MAIPYKVWIGEKKANAKDRHELWYWKNDERQMEMKFCKEPSRLHIFTSGFKMSYPLSNGRSFIDVVIVCGRCGYEMQVRNHYMANNKVGIEFTGCSRGVWWNVGQYPYS